MTVTEQALMGALQTVVDPNTGRDFVSAKAIKNLSIQDGDVSFDVELGYPAKSQLAGFRKSLIAAAKGVPGVANVSVNVSSKIVAHAVQRGVQLLPRVKNIVAVASGKGGVGKSTVAANLAIALAQTGARVGLLDGDIYGPNLPRMMGVQRQPYQKDGKIMPVEAHGIRFMSMGLLVDAGEAVVWRGPMLHGAIKSFLSDVDWSGSDYLVVDLPPGTGDVQLSLIQQTVVTGAVIVTTPSMVAIEDSVKAVRMFEKLQVPVMGLIENMSYFMCGNCSTRHDIFSTGEARDRALALGLPFLGALPIEPAVRKGGDTGAPIVAAQPDSEAAAAFRTIAGALAQRISIATLSGVGAPA